MSEDPYDHEQDEREIEDRKALDTLKSQFTWGLCIAALIGASAMYVLEKMFT